jgi:REP element-mobilizing transposase RayT
MSQDLLPQRKAPIHFPAIERPNRSILYFVTICTQDRRPILASPSMHQKILDAWHKADSFLVGRYVLMPDHIHLFCAPGTFSTALSTWICYWKSLVTKQFSVPIWQRDFWDTQLRRNDSYSAKWEYVCKILFAKVFAKKRKPGPTKVKSTL